MAAKVAVVHCTGYERKNVEESVQAAINLLGGISRFIQPGGKVLIKPNLCTAEPPEKGITTHPEIVRAAARMCNAAGADVIIGDNQIGDADHIRSKHIWECTGMEAGLEGIPYRRSLLDKELITFNCKIKEQEHSFYISREVFDMKLIINIPKFKTHVLTTFTGAVKNLYGLLPGNLKKKLHSELPVEENFSALLVDIYRLVKPGLHILDAVVGIEGEGPGVRGKRRNINLILASEDGLALDSVAAGIMNVDARHISTNRVGSEKGYGEINPESIEILGESLEKYILHDFLQPSTFRYNPAVTERIFNLSRAYVKIIPRKCKACNLCVSNCPANAVHISGGIAAIDQEVCIACLVCHEICPEGAVCVEHSDFYKQLKALRNKSRDVNPGNGGLEYDS